MRDLEIRPARRPRFASTDEARRCRWPLTRLLSTMMAGMVRRPLFGEASYTNGSGVRGDEGYPQFRGAGAGGGGVRGENGDRAGDGGPLTTMTFSRRFLLRGGSPKKADRSRPWRRLLLGRGLSSLMISIEGRPDDVDDRGGVFIWLRMNSDVGSSQLMRRGVFSRVECISHGLPGRPNWQSRVWRYSTWDASG